MFPNGRTWTDMDGQSWTKLDSGRPVNKKKIFFKIKFDDENL